MKVFFLNRHKATDFIWSGQSYTSFNLLRILNLFYKNYWPCLPSSSKCRWSVHHGDIKFWFSRDANTGRHCLLLQIHLSYSTRCIKSFKKIADKSFKLFHFDNFALTMTILPRKLVRQIFWFPKYTLYLHQELIYSHWQNRLGFHKGKFE